MVLLIVTESTGPEIQLFVQWGVRIDFLILRSTRLQEAGIVLCQSTPELGMAPGTTTFH